VRVMRAEEGALHDAALNVDARELEKAALAIKLADAVVCTGVGKSYHVASLVADTLQSVGIRAVHMHATEVDHGGSGFLHADDVVMGFSCSGRTAETHRAANVARERGCGIVWVTATSQWMSQHNDVVLCTGVGSADEAIGVVPTSSVVAMLGVSHELVARVMKRHEHAGGALGEVLRGVGGGS
jgi:arabinose-5-phosphate isomerase